MRRRRPISLSAATGLLETIRAAGANPDQILRPLGLDPTALSKPDGFIASSDFGRLLEAAAQATGDDCFGLHFGEHYNPKNVGPLAYVVLNSPTFAVGFQNVARYLNVHNEAAKVSFDVEGTGRTFDTSSPTRRSRRHGSTTSTAWRWGGTRSA